MPAVSAGHASRLRFEFKKLNLHQAGREFEPKTTRPTPGAIELCFTTLVPLEEVEEHLRAESVAIERGRA